jgi:hypothetical protein
MFLAQFDLGCNDDQFCSTAIERARRNVRNAMF